MLIKRKKEEEEEHVLCMSYGKFTRKCSSLLNIFLLILGIAFSAISLKISCKNMFPDICFSNN